MYKIAVGGIAIESCTFNPLRTTLDDFTIWRDGVDFPTRYPFLSEFPDTQFLPTIRARALPGAPVDTAAYQYMKGELLERLAADGPVDAVYLDMHGAMNVADMDDAEGDLYESVRKLVGPDVLIAASYDLHGNLSPRIIDNLNLLSAYRTAPHIDDTETRQRTVDLLLRALRTGTRPYMVRQFIPVLLPGEKTSTEWEPGESLYRRIPEFMGGDVWDVSILIGYAWADEPRSGANVVGVGTDKGQVDAVVKTLATAFWDVREQFEFGVPALPTDDCIQGAMASDARPVFISDSGDNPTAGGVGDTTGLLARLLALGATDVIYASIVDPTAVAICVTAGEGAAVDLSVGGKMDQVNAPPLPIRGIVRAIRPSENTEVVVRADGVDLILTARRRAYHHIASFNALGLDPHAVQMVVVKIGYLEPELKAAANRAFLALSPGVVNQDIPRLPYQRVQRPIFPLDADVAWTPDI